MIDVIFYAPYEGGILQPWKWGPVDITELNKRDYKYIYLKEQVVHAIYYDKKGDVRRWDCVNGYTGSLGFTREEIFRLLENPND